MKNLIKNTFLDILSLFKNFIHWNFSKIIISIVSFFLGILLTIPLLLVYYVFTGFSFIDLTILVSSIVISGQLLTGLFANIIYVLTVLFFRIGYYYSYVLLAKLYFGYIKGKKQSFKENLYFNYKRFIKYFLLSIVYLIILLIPSIIFVVICLVIVGLMGGAETVTSIIMGGPNNIFTILFGLFFILSILSTFYLGYRFIFSYFLLLEEKYKKKGVFKLLQKSFSITKSFKKLMKFLSVTVLLFIVFIISGTIGLTISKSNIDLNNYMYYVSIDDGLKTELINNDSYYYNSLIVKYDGLEYVELESKEKTTDLFLLIFSIGKFLIIEGLFIMLLASFYKRIIIKK